MPNPDVNAINSLFMTNQQMRPFDHFKAKLSPEDLKWVNSEAERITNDYGYRLSERSSLESAFRLYWLEQGHSFEEMINLDQMEPAE